MFVTHHLPNSSQAHLYSPDTPTPNSNPLFGAANGYVATHWGVVTLSSPLATPIKNWLCLSQKPSVVSNFSGGSSETVVGKGTERL